MNDQKESRAVKKARAGKRNLDATATSDRVEGTEPPETSDAIAEKAREAITINLRRIQRHTITVRIAGDSLILHAWGPKVLRKLLQDQQRSEEEKKEAKKKREPKNPHNDFMEARYLRDGKDYFPANGLKQAMTEAGAEIKIPRTAIRRHVRILGDLVEIKGCKPVMREDVTRVGPFSNRQPDLRYRPHFTNWHADVMIRYTVDLFTPEQIVALVDRAGCIGIGEWRADKKGEHGGFEVVGLVDAKGKVQDGQ